MKLLYYFFFSMLLTGLTPHEMRGDEMPGQYQLLQAKNRKIREGTVINYAVSVDKLLNHEQIAKLICLVIRNHKPSSYAILTVTIYYKLDKLPPYVIYTPGGNNIEDGLIATYVWNRDVPSNHIRLTIWRDISGNILKPAMSIDYSHETDCKP